MKIGIDIRPALEEPAGIGKVTLNLTERLASVGRDHSFVLYANKPFDLKLPRERFTPVVVRCGNFAPGRLLWHFAALIRARFIDKVDLLISVASLQSAALTREFVLLVVPDLTNVLFPEWHVGKPRLTGRLLLRRALRHARGVIAISEQTRDDIARYMGGSLRPDAVSVAYIGCDDAFAVVPSQAEIEDVQRRYGLRPGYILSVGTIEPRKNHARLIAAFSGLASSNGDVDLVIVGRKGWKWEDAFEAARTSGCASRIRFLEFVPQTDLPAVYAGATMLAYPSLYEGFGIPPLEAMTVGVPVVTSSVSSLPEVVGDAALLVDPRDIEALREAMVRLLSDSDLRRTLVEKGRRRAQRFSWESFAQSVLMTAEGKG